MVSERNIRFSPNGECRQLALDYVTQVFDAHSYSYEEVKLVNTSTKTLQFLKLHSFNFILVLPIFSLLSPITWYQIIMFSGHIIFSSGFDNIIEKFKLKYKRYAVIYHISPKRLYNVSGEYWTHCVSSVYDKGTCKIFDPLYDLLKEEYKNKIHPPNEKKLNKGSNSKLLIWK